MFQCPFIGPVLDFDADRPAIADVREHTEKLIPMDVTQSRQLWCVVQIRSSHDADLVSFFLVDPHVFRMNVDQSIGELANRL